MPDTKSKTCPHGTYNPDFKMVSTKVTNLNIQQMVLKVKVVCSLCGKNFIFKGQTGFSTSDTRVSPDGYELRVPLDYPDDPDVEEEEVNVYEIPKLVH